PLMTTQPLPRRRVSEDADAGGGGVPRTPASDDVAPVWKTAGSDKMAPTGSIRGTSSRFVQIPLDELVANPDQPRRTFHEQSLREMAASIKERGVLEPIVVRPIATEDGRPRFEIVMGERRVRAAKMAGLPFIPALVRDLSDKDAAADALLENFQREDLSPIDRARAIQSLLEMMSIDDVARTLGVTESTLRRHLDLLKLPDAVQDAFARLPAGPGEFSFTEGHALALLALGDDPTSQIRLMTKAQEEKIPISDLTRVVEAVKTYPEKKEAFLRVPVPVTDQILRHLGQMQEKRKKYRPQSAEKHFGALRKAAGEIVELSDERIAAHLDRQKLAHLLSATHEAEAMLGSLGDALRKTLRDIDDGFQEVYIHCHVCGSVELTAAGRCSLCGTILRRCYDCQKYDRAYERCQVDEYPVYVGEATDPKEHSRSYPCPHYTPKREVLARLPVTRGYRPPPP
ncbi:MAG TPA: ParB/RepB/Spo0J family partition protein, partial [Armatimonadaceae bacterium]|nr:ParB/RepB/Spo0J family partition protein [Armatimonadaceae bacterium]